MLDFEIKTDYSDRREIWLNNKYVLGLNHDEHGREGMEVAETIIQILVDKGFAKLSTGEILDDE